MTESTADESRLIEKVKSLADQQTIEWMEKKSKELVKLMAYYRCALMEIETKFNVLNVEFSLQHDRNPINSIKSRLKSLPSIQDKLERKHLPMTLKAIEENLNDVAGVRVICAFPEDVYTLANALLKQDDIELIDRKDYIQNPKPSGYRSLHLIVSVPIFLENEKRIMKVEIQLRTIAMDMWASLEHELRYKSDRSWGPEESTRLRLCSDAIYEIDREMQNIYQGKAPEYED